MDELKKMINESNATTAIEVGNIIDEYLTKYFKS